MEKKTLHVEMKDEDQGIVQARFATLGVKDKQGDVIERGAFGRQDVRVSAFGHTSWMGELPVGKGAIQEKGDAALADLQFFLSMQAGREHFEAIKGLGTLGEWSFGFDVLEEAAPTEEQRQVGVRRVLKKLKVHEVSPVLLGAGVDTATLAVKSDDGKAEPEPTIPQEPVAPEPTLPDPEVKSTDALQEAIAAEVARFEALKFDAMGVV